MQLKINKTPFITSYAHHAYANAIITGCCGIYEDDDQRNLYANEMMNLHIDECLSQDWRIIGKEELVEISQNGLVLREDSGTECHGEFFIYHPVLDKREICVDIPHIKIDAQDAIFNIFVAIGDVEQCINNNEAIYRFGFTQKLFLSRYNNDFRKSAHVKQISDMKIKIVLEGEGIDSYIYENGAYVLFDHVTIGASDKPIFLGVNVNNLGSEMKEQYDTWMAMNYLQLYYNKRDIVGKVWLDYKMHPMKNYRYEYAIFSQFLDIDYLELSEIKELFGDFLEFIKWSLQHGYYVALPLNEFYIPHRLAYQDERYIHHNLIYGLDEERGVVNILGYDKKIISDEISIEQFMAACKEICGEVIRYRFFPNERSLKFDFGYVRDGIRNYLLGKKGYESNIMSDERGYYGIEALKELGADERGRFLLCNDFRVSFVIYEHAVIMDQRIKYLKKHLGKAVAFEEIDKESAGLIDITRELKNLVIKNMFRKNLEGSICDLLKQVIEKEKALLEKLLELLSG